MKVHVFKYRYFAEIQIKANRNMVWKVLRDESSYSKWNPFTPKIETSWEIGEPVHLTVQMKPDKKEIGQKEVLRKLDPPKEMVWGLNWSILLRAERCQKLTEKPDGSTVYFTEDIIQGLLSPLVNKMYGKYIQRGFEQVARALKEFVEKE